MTATAYTAQAELPPTAPSVPAARHILGELLHAWAADHLLDDAALLLSELVTNVVRHVAPAACLVLSLELTAPRLRVAVTDASPTPPHIQQAPPRTRRARAHPRSRPGIPMGRGETDRRKAGVVRA
jgi:anti-sigma regulatory factor (Ser/Thr protein kinase)